MNHTQVSKRLKSMERGDCVLYFTGSTGWSANRDFQWLVNWSQEALESGEYTFVQRKVGTGVYDHLCYRWKWPHKVGRY